MSLQDPLTRIGPVVLVLFVEACGSAPPSSPGTQGGSGGADPSGGSPLAGTSQAGGIRSTAGGGTGGVEATSGGTSAGGNSAVGGTRNTGGVAQIASGGNPAGSGGSAAPGSGGQAGGIATNAGGGGGTSSFVCPSPPFSASPVASGAAPERIAGVPPSDAFLGTSSDVIILEGPVWFDGSLYVSEINDGPPTFGGPSGGGMGGMGEPASDAPPARVLKITEAGTVSVALPDSGTNGLAIDPNGNLVGCSHKTGSVARFSLAGAQPVDLVSTYMGIRFDSPNDLTFGADGTLYFTDPNYQAPSPVPQAATRVYRVSPGTSAAIPTVEGRPQPNGITFSPDRKTLYISGSDGVFSYPVMPDGSLGTGTRFAQAAVRSSDSMAMDCAGNLYATSSQDVVIVDPSGAEVGRISVPGVQSVTNVAFGGAEHKTLYITALGSGTRSGLFKISGAIPGMPY